MDVITPAINAVVVLVATLVLTWYGRDRFKEIDRRFGEVDERFREARSDLATGLAGVNRRLDDIQRDIAQTRSDLTHVALAVGAARRPDSA